LRPLCSSLKVPRCHEWDDGLASRSVLECGGRTLKGWRHRFREVCDLRMFKSLRKRRRRCALPPHSKTLARFSVSPELVRFYFNGGDDQLPTNRWRGLRFRKRRRCLIRGRLTCVGRTEVLCRPFRARVQKRETQGAALGWHVPGPLALSYAGRPWTVIRLWERDLAMKREARLMAKMRWVLGVES
jgi:hypothetical protein